MIKFAKMHGNGNDFVMVNTPKGEKSYEIKEILYK